MVELFDVAVARFSVPGGLWFGYRALRATNLHQILSTAEADSTADITDGESIAIEGEVVVDEPVDTAESAVTSTEPSVAVYLWRASFPKSGCCTIDFDDRKLEQNKATFASGIESGTFTVSDESLSVRVDPEWLAETHDSPAIDTLTVGGTTKSDTFSTYLWDAPCTHLSSNTDEFSLNRLLGVVNKHSSDVDLDRYVFESRAIPENTSLAVYGEAQIDQGTPVIRGTEDTPLLVPDSGFQAHSDMLRLQMIKYGFISMVLLTVVALLFLL